MKALADEKGIVFNVQHFSVHDGPGIRTVVFLKGCPLRCRWCANPESQSALREIGWTENECIHCECCISQLKELDCSFDQKQQLIWNKNAAFEPADVSKCCPSKALHVIGEERCAESILREVQNDYTFYKNSGGGLTVSGGEPLLQPEFLLKLLQLAGNEQIHRAIETTLYCSLETVKQICSELELLIVDLKSMDDDRHKEWIGVSNKKIIQNITAVRELFPDLPMLVRTPVIPGFNDSTEDIEEILKFLDMLKNNGNAKVQYELLKYHKLGEPKYRSLKREYGMKDAELSDESFSALKKYVAYRQSDMKKWK